MIGKKENFSSDRFAPVAFYATKTNKGITPILYYIQYNHFSFFLDKIQNRTKIQKIQKKIKQINQEQKSEIIQRLDPQLIVDCVTDTDELQ